MAKLFNHVKMTVSGTPGTGTITLGTAVSAAFATFAEAGVADTNVVSYVIEDGNDFEIGIGTYTSAGTTLSRDTVRLSKIGGTAGTTKLTLTSNAIVYLSPAKEDLGSLSEANTWAAQQTFSAAVNLTSGQLIFPATQNASADANTLDDCEKGTWTPSIAGATTAGTQTYSIQIGHYTKIGNVVIATCNMELSAKDAATNGAMRIRGLPFTSKNVANLIQSVALGAYGAWDLNAASGYTHMAGAVAVNDVDIALVECGDNVARAALTEADFAATSTIRATTMYLT